MKFANRKEELEFLNRLYREDKFHFIPVYGRRRIGKTRLIQEFVKDKPAIYYLADSVAEQEQLRNLGREVGAFFGDNLLSGRGFDGWEQFFEYMKSHAGERMLLVIDEFPYLVNSNKGISSIFQKGIDQYLAETKLFLILMGSSIGMMEREVLFYKAPLYGRRTGSLELKEMEFKTLKEFFPGKRMDELVSIYGVAGSIPAYLEQFDPEFDIFRNIGEFILDKRTFLYNEVEFLLREELREPRNYFVILRSIAQGKRKLSEIINDTGFEKSLLSRYLEILRSLRFVEKEVPVTEKYF
ncbi:MAG: ATP-binding protein, partial [Deltaproteobacteria bacterium]|nr:ATP-binding protein [Deltaproteobacteria bacterium]